MIHLNPFTNNSFFESISKKAAGICDAISTVAKRVFASMICVSRAEVVDIQATEETTVENSEVQTIAKVKEKAGFASPKDTHHEVGNARREGIYKTFMAQQNPDDPRTKRLEEITDPSLGENDVEVNTYTVSSDVIIDVPDGPALKLAAEHYAEKYGIEIHFCSGYQEDTLENMITTLNDQIKTPTYVGIIYENDPQYRQKKYDFGHVTPLLFYFPGNGQLDKAECLDLDSVAQQGARRSVKQLGLASVYGMKKVRQADKNSCRTGAITILRNALLHLKKNNVQNGFGEVLKQCQVEGHKIAELPPEWDYTEQFSNKSLKDTHQAIRSCFSKNVEKRGETAKQFRERHMRTRQFTLEVNYRSDSTTEAANPLPEGVKTSKVLPDYPKDVYAARLNITRNVNDYLLEKGHKFKKMIDPL